MNTKKKTVTKSKLQTNVREKNKRIAELEAQLSEEQRIATFREEIRNGRVSQASREHAQGGHDDDLSAGTTFEAARTALEESVGKLGTPYTGSGQTGTDTQSPSQELGGSGRSLGGSPEADERARDSDRRTESPQATTTKRLGVFQSEDPGIVLSALPKNNQMPGTMSVRDEIAARYPRIPQLFQENPLITAKQLRQKLGGKFLSSGQAEELHRQWIANSKEQAQPQPKKESWTLPQLPKFNIGGSSKVITDEEADQVADELRAALGSDFDYIDQYIWTREAHVNIDNGREPIWSDTTDHEMNALVTLLMKRAKKDPATAAVVRGIISTNDYLVVGAMVAPRFMSTVKRYQASKPTRVKRGMQHASATE